jgi:hypothetical protein
MTAEGTVGAPTCLLCIVRAVVSRGSLMDNKVREKIQLYYHNIYHHSTQPDSIAYHLSEKYTVYTHTLSVAKTAPSLSYFPSGVFDCYTT